MGFAILHCLPLFVLLSLFFWWKRLFCSSNCPGSTDLVLLPLRILFWCPILIVSKFFNHFRGNSNLQKNGKQKKEKKRTANKATNEQRKAMRSSFFAYQRHFVFFLAGTLVCCKFYGKRVVELLGGLLNTPACFVDTSSLEFALRARLLHIL